MPSGQNVPAVAVFLAGIAVVIWGCIWGCTRGWRMEVRLDDLGVTVRNFLRIHRFGWAEVRRFEDAGSIGYGHSAVGPGDDRDEGLAAGQHNPSPWQRAE